MSEARDREMAAKLLEAAAQADVPVSGGRVCRTSSRFCLGVEHGDYNGTELFGVGTDRFIWMAYSASDSPRMRLLSLNYPDTGVLEFGLEETPPPRSLEFADSWERFPLGVVHILRREGFELRRGLNAVLYGNIPGGGMSRSASLTLNLLLSLLDANGLEVGDPFRIVEMAQAVETDYIGSPCGQLDQIMILFAREGLGTHFRPRRRTVEHVPLGKGPDFRLVSLDTGTKRPGLEKSTYKIRRAECEDLVELLQHGYGIKALADVRDGETYERIQREFGERYPDLCARLRYIYFAQKRFPEMLEAWRSGDIATVGSIFRQDGYGLRDDYRISGPELEAMCDIARTVNGVYGERMLGGGDKGAAGAIVSARAMGSLAREVDRAYPALYPEVADRYAVHALRVVQGIEVRDGLL